MRGVVLREVVSRGFLGVLPLHNSSWNNGRHKLRWILNLLSKPSYWECLVEIGEIACAKLAWSFGGLFNIVKKQY